jgi:hypothetical protein
MQAELFDYRAMNGRMYRDLYLQRHSQPVVKYQQGIPSREGMRALVVRGTTGRLWMRE